MNAGKHMDEGDAGAAVSCSACPACCCRLEVFVMGDDDIPLALTVEDAWGAVVMRRLDDGWCAALNRHTFRCTIYARRPDVCREYPMGGSDCLVERARGAGGTPDRRADYY